jgi:serine/threonine protein kinase
VGVPFTDPESEAFKNEVLLRRTLTHTSIVAMLGVCTEVKPAVMLLEYMKQGSLRGYLKKQAVGLPLMLQMALDIALGMEYLAGKAVVHRDLSVDTCLVSMEGKVKMNAFALARTVQVDKSEYEMGDTSLIEVGLLFFSWPPCL